LIFFSVMNGNDVSTETTRSMNKISVLICCLKFKSSGLPTTALYCLWNWAHRYSMRYEGHDTVSMFFGRNIFCTRSWVLRLSGRRLQTALSSGMRRREVSLKFSDVIFSVEALVEKATSK
jgi:hypothetical protein